MQTTEQINFWKGDFGKDYTDRNSHSDENWDQFYRNAWGISKLDINQECLEGLPLTTSFLEVGCNTGMQLRGLQRMGFTHLYGIEIQPYAVEKAKTFTKDINVINGSGFDLPFRNAYFDVVCTNGVLIHIQPNDLPTIMREMYRCSKKYICGFEYFAEQTTEIKYRGHDNKLWKADYAALFIELFPDLKVAKKKLYPYIADPHNRDCMYLLEKQ